MAYSIDEIFDTAATLSAVCVVDPITRQISVPSEYNLFGVSSDEKVNRIHFRCPRIVGDGIDLSELHLYVNYRNANNDTNVYLVDDVVTDGDDIIFSWLLSRNVTAYAGTVNFIVCAKKSDGENLLNEWNTKIATGTVGQGLEATTNIEKEIPDILEQILVNLDTVKSSVTKLQNQMDQLSNSLNTRYASSDKLGMIKVGSDFDISEDGVLTLYKELSLSASIEPNAVEFGSVVDTVVVKWTTNKIPNSVTVAGNTVDPRASKVELTNQNLTANKTYTVKATDNRMETTKNVAVQFYHYVYSKVGSPDAMPSSATDCVKQANTSTFSNNGAAFNYNADDVIWLLTIKSGMKIQTNVLGKWADVDTFGGESVEFTLANGAKATYYAYRTGSFSVAGEATYRLV